MAILSIATLPVELIHRIFDELDTETIIFSIRSLSKKFQAVVNTYNRFILNFRSISKLNFCILSRLINPQNIMTLTLSNDVRASNQIALFISLVRLQQFTRLRYLTLLNIDEYQLQYILLRIDLSFLKSFSFSIREYDSNNTNITTGLLTSIITRSNLQKMELKMNNERLSNFSWPIKCTIQSLTIINDITMDNLLQILECSPYLHTLILDDVRESINKNLSLRYFKQLTSLTMKWFRATIAELKSFLLMTPSLVYLKLIGSGQMLDGKRWEEFITNNLPDLNKFEFHFHEVKFNCYTEKELESIISAFQTPFWIEQKKWFVICESNIPRSNNIDVYSIPICKTTFMYITSSQKISLPNCSMIVNKDPPSIMSNITSLYLILNKVVADDILKKKTTHSPLFPKVTEICLLFEKDWPLLSLQSLSIFIDISQIVLMVISSKYSTENKQNPLIDFELIMKQAHNLSSLIIEDNNDQFKSNGIMEHIYSILSHRLKHLQIRIDDLDQIKIILEQCENLITIKFDNKNKKFREKVVKWFADNTINSTYQEDDGVLVWLGKKKINQLKLN